MQKFSSLGSPFVAQYARRRDLAMRALHWKQLFDPVLPGIFLAWAKRTDIAVPADLVETVQQRGVQVSDWKTLYDEAMALRKRESEAAESQIADWKRLHDKVMAQLDKEHSKWLEVARVKRRADSGPSNAQRIAGGREVPAAVGFPECQSACKFDPSSASNFDPFERRGLVAALGSSELAGIAETRRARVA